MGIVRSAARGAVAGVIATAAMDLVWYRRYRAGGGESGFVEWEFSSTVGDFEDAPAPAQVGKRLADAVGIDLPDDAVGATNNVVHWTTGIGWGKVGGLLASMVPLPRPVIGVVAGVAAWGSSYALLAPLGIYRPMREYDRETLRDDLSAHLVFGATLGVALAVLGRDSD